MHRIHIVGAGPRTGTTLLAECMAACFDIDAVEAHEASICRHRRDVNIYLTKRPNDLPIIGARLRIDRHLYVVAMLRDPRDVIVSRHRLDPERYWAPLRFWKWHSGLIRRFAHHPRFVVVRYETLVSEPNAVQDELMRRMPFLKMKRRFTNFHEIARPSVKSLRALGELRPIAGSSIGTWRQHLPRVAGQIAIHGSIAQDLIEFGYERDEKWLTELAGIEPDSSASHWPEHAPVPRWRLRRRKYAEAARIGAARLLRLPIL